MTSILRQILPALCIPLMAGAAVADADDDAARAAFMAGFSGPCSSAFLEDGMPIEEGRRWDFIAPSTWGEPQPVSLWQFRCNLGAYNEQSVFIAKLEYDGFVPLAFATPVFETDHAVPGDSATPLTGIRTIGWATTPYVINGEFDPDTLKLVETAYWRGLGDASNIAVSRFVDGGFRLIRYDVDPTFDEEINPVTLVSFE